MQNTKIESSFYFILAATVLLIPLRFVVAWCLAVFIHEASHYLVLRLCRIKVFGIRVSASGVRIHIGEISGWKEIFGALSGPIGGLSVLLLRHWLPCTAIFGLIHSCYNILPIFSLDGGRALKAVLVKLFGSLAGEKAHYCISCGLIILIAVTSAYLCFHYNLPFLLLGIIWIPVTIRCLRKIPCKHPKQIVQ